MSEKIPITDAFGNLIGYIGGSGLGWLAVIFSPFFIWAIISSTPGLLLALGGFLLFPLTAGLLVDRFYRTKYLPAIQEGKANAKIKLYLFCAAVILVLPIIGLLIFIWIWNLNMGL